MATIKIKPTATLAKKLNETSPYQVERVRLTIDQFTMLVDVDGWLCNINDYNSSLGVMESIKVTYPASYYAMPRYITGRELIKIGRGCDTIDDYRAAFNEYVEI